MNVCSGMVKKRYCSGGIRKSELRIKIRSVGGRKGYVTAGGRRADYRSVFKGGDYECDEPPSDVDDRGTVADRRFSGRMDALCPDIQCSGFSRVVRANYGEVLPLLHTPVKPVRYVEVILVSASSVEYRRILNYRNAQ